MGFAEWLAASGLAEAVAEGTVRMEIIGDRYVVLENHRGVMEYGDGVLRVDCGGRTVRIEGEGLELAALSLTELAVRGQLRAVCWEDSGEGGKA